MERQRLTLIGRLALLIGAAVMVTPLAWALLLSLKSNAALVGHSEAALHGPYTLENYGAILGNSLTLRWLLNSMIVSLGTTAGVLILTSLAGYGFARLDFPFRRTLFVLVILGLAVPSQAVILPQHQLFAWLHLHNTYPGLILPGLVAPFGVFFMTTYMRGIPVELDEAAMLDGASRWTIFWKVILPLTVPAQSTLAVFTFLGSWNDYWWPLISATRSDMYTLTVGLAAAQMNYAQTSGLGYLMAQAVFASIPIFIVYIVFQKQIVRAMAGRASDEARRICGVCAARARQLQQTGREDPHLSPALLRRVRRRIWMSTDIAKAEGECGIITTIVDRFNAQNPDIHIDVNVVAWPGYPQLTAQMAARDPPDLVTMHEGVISDYQSSGLLEPADPYLRAAGISADSFTDAARQGVTIGKHIYGLPIDTHGGLFHVNTALFAKAGLMRGGKPVLPTSAQELVQQARQFEAGPASPI